MKKLAFLALASVILAGCATQSTNNNMTDTHKDTFSAESLVHHRFILQDVNGKPLQLPNHVQIPELSFGENMQISGSMCNRFAGKASLTGNILKADTLAMTRMMCAEPQLNELDNQFGQMMSAGVDVKFNGQQLTLTHQKNTLVYKLEDLY